MTIPPISSRIGILSILLLCGPAEASRPVFSQRSMAELVDSACAIAVASPVTPLTVETPIRSPALPASAEPYRAHSLRFVVREVMFARPGVKLAAGEKILVTSTNAPMELAEHVGRVGANRTLSYAATRYAGSLSGVALGEQKEVVLFLEAATPGWPDFPGPAGFTAIDGAYESSALRLKVSALIKAGPGRSDVAPEPRRTRDDPVPPPEAPLPPPSPAAPPGPEALLHSPPARGASLHAALTAGAKAPAPPTTFKLVLRDSHGLGGYEEFVVDDSGTLTLSRHTYQDGGREAARRIKLTRADLDRLIAALVQNGVWGHAEDFVPPPDGDSTGISIKVGAEEVQFQEQSDDPAVTALRNLIHELGRDAK